MVFKSYQNSEDIIKVPKFEENNGFYTTTKQSVAMSKIKSKNSKVELILRKALWKQNIRFRLHSKKLIGIPDILIEKYKLVIFVDGDFWHGFNWEKRRKEIRQNPEFWTLKIERNIQRDRFVNESLELKGYTVMRFWEHQIKKNLSSCVNQVCLYIESTKQGMIPINSI